MSTSKPSTKQQKPLLTTTADYNTSLQAGQRAYDERKYEEALSHLDVACRALSGRSIRDQLHVLDLKCSVLLKLDKLDTALDTAKSMLRADKQSARGYCRCAAIEKQQGNLAVAAKYLQHGSVRVPKTDKLYQYLIEQSKRVQDALQQATITMKPVDPMTALPLELAQMVIAHLDYEQVVSMLRVSRNWKKLLSRLEPLTTTLDFRKSKMQVSALMLRAALDRMVYPKSVAIQNVQPNMTWLILKALNRPSKFASLENLIMHNPKLSVHALQYNKFKLKSISFGMECEVGLGQVLSVLDACPLLSEAVFKRVRISPVGDVRRHECLEVLELGNAFDLSAFSIPPSCFSHYRKLRSLTVNGAAVSTKTSWDLSKNKNLRHLDTYASVIRSIQLPSSLEEWLWDGTEVAQFVNTRETLAATIPLPNLHTLCLSGDNTQSVLNYLRASQVQYDQLRRIGLHNRQGFAILRTTAPEFRLFSSAHDVSLEFEFLIDEDFDRFVSCFPDIRTLQLAAPRISGAFIADLLKRPGNQVRKLVLKDCRTVSPDTVAWARARGVQVEVHLGRIEVRGGRRLREGWF